MQFLFHIYKCLSETTVQYSTSTMGWLKYTSGTWTSAYCHFYSSGLVLKASQTLYL